MPQEVKYTTISVQVEVRDTIRRQKRGQETYSGLLAKMAKSYDPDDGTPS